MMRIGLVGVWASLGLISACNIPLERYHRPDGAPVADAAIDAAPDPLAQRAYIKASNTGAGDSFGKSVALSADGSTLAVGAFREASASRGVEADQGNNDAPDAGAVYVFVRSGMAWTQQAYVKAANADGNDFFGISVALSADGSTLAVGAYSEDSASAANPDDNTAFAAGAAYVFTRSGAAWSQQAYVKASNIDTGDAFGKSVALSADGSTLAVGAYHEDGGSTGVGGNPADNSVGDAGAAYVFTRSGVMWTQQAYIKAAVVAAFDEFGTSVALSGDGSTLAVGASREALGGNVGAVEVFTRSGAVWSQQTRLTRTQAGGAFGNSVALSADGATLAAGASREASSGAPGGAVYVFARGGTTWSEQMRLVASNAAALDEFGASVALSADGAHLLVGAPGEDSAATGIGGDPSSDAASASGAVYLFARGGAWTQQAYLKASNTDAGDGFGASVALSADGATLAAGASSEDSAAKGVGGDQADDSAADAGAVYVFR